MNMEIGTLCLEFKDQDEIKIGDDISIKFHLFINRHGRKFRIEIKSPKSLNIKRSNAIKTILL